MSCTHRPRTTSESTDASSTASGPTSITLVPSLLGLIEIELHLTYPTVQLLQSRRFLGPLSLYDAQLLGA